MKASVKYLLVSVLTALFVATAFTGTLLGFVIAESPVAPPGGIVLWGTERHAWERLHLYLALGTIALVGLHIWSNRQWLRPMSRRSPPRSLARWVVLVLVAVAAVVLIGMGIARLVSR